MSIYISIGDKCCVKHQIDKYKGSKETLFFDFIGTDMKSVITILASEHIEEILYFDNIFRDSNQPNGHDGKKARVTIRSLSRCISVHDLPINMKDQDVYEFIEKYKRRFQRIIDNIKSNRNDKIFFLRYGPITDKEKSKFIEIIHTINPNCQFTLVSLEIEQSENIIEKEPGFLRIKKTDKNNTSDWEKNFLNWKQIFTDIEQPN